MRKAFFRSLLLLYGLSAKLACWLLVARDGALDTLVEPQEIFTLVVNHEREGYTDSDEYPKQKAAHCAALLIIKSTLERRPIIRGHGPWTINEARQRTLDCVVAGVVLGSLRVLGWTRALRTESACPS